ncbi:MAG: hypothetical protein ACOYLO_09550, partial [Ferruginibacter sp.]
MKKIIFLFVLSILSITVSAQKAASSKTYYSYVYYFAQPERNIYKRIFEQNLVATKENGYKMEQKIKQQYCEFIKKNHPEYYAWYGVDDKMSQEEKDRRIMAQAGVQMFYEKQTALDALKMDMDEWQKKYDKNPADEAAVVKSYEFSFKQ